MISHSTSYVVGVLLLCISLQDKVETILLTKRSPEETISTYLEALHNRQDVSDLVCCEFSKKDYYPLFSQMIVTNNKLSYQREDYAIVSITLIQASDIVRNAYFHLSKSGGLWKITGFRSLVIPNNFYSIADQYSQSSLEDLKEMYDQRASTYAGLSDANIKVDAGTFSDYLAEARRIQLFTSQDDSIIAFFKRKESQFNFLAEHAIQGNKKTIDSIQYELSIKSATIEEPGYDKYEIDRWGDNSVGFLFVKNKENVPNPTISRYILIQKINNNWYLYKET